MGVWCDQGLAGAYDRVVDDLNKMPGAQWFEGARLNYAENLLRYRDDQTALIFKGETKESKKITYTELYSQVAALAKSLKELGGHSRRSGGRIHAQYDGDHHRHAGRHFIGGGLVFLLA